MSIKHCFFIISMVLLATTFQSCTKPEEPTPAKETSTVIDIDSNVYKTVKIGNQWWMAENLRVTKFRNGASVSEIQGNDEWRDITTASYCNYNNTVNDAGFLYNYHVIEDSNNIAPEGWHIPSDEEWKQLETHLGMTPSDADGVNWRGNTEGDKLKIEGPQGWTVFNNVWGNNESGFAALGGSCRMFDGQWGDPGLFANGFWWSSTTHSDDDKAWYRHLDYKNSNVFRYHGSKNYGFSIRCVKD